MRLDHVSYAVDADSFASTIGRLGSRLGASFHDGGVHPRFGTRNFLLSLAGGTYLEVVEPLEHPATGSAPFGRAVKQRAAEGGGWLGWVARVDDITPVEERLGRQAVEGHRVRPDHVDLKWCQIGVLDLIEEPQLPYVIQWKDMDQHPSKDTKSEIRISKLEIAGDAKTVSDWLGEPARHPLDEVEVEWVTADEPGLVAVTFATSEGEVRLD